MYTVNWDKFNVKNPDKQNAFERMCRHLFMRKFKISGYDFTANYNQAGLETEPIKFDGKHYGFQCKYSTNHNSTSFYKQVYDSLDKAFKIYKDNLNEVYIYTNLDIKPECTKEELADQKLTTDRVKIQRMAKELNIALTWIKEENFSELLNEIGNLDIYRLYFSAQNEVAFMDSNISIEDRTFLKSDSFLELQINGKGFKEIQDVILDNKISAVIGGAGTGKTEIMKKMYLHCSEKFLENYSKSANIESEAIPIPIFIRLRECLQGDLENLIRFRLQDYNISLVDAGQKFSYFFDGLDEVSINDVVKIITTVKAIIGKENTKSVVISSRNSSPNLTFLQRDLELEIYKIDALNQNIIDLYFEKKIDVTKIKKYTDIKENIQTLLEEIEDIFSINLLWKTIENINNETTKIDLILQSTNQLIDNHRKLVELNLPEIKSQSIETILADVSLLLQTERTLSISVSKFQDIIRARYFDLTYKEIDSIIHVLAEMFFDISSDEKKQFIYSYKHRRYHEYFLYKKLSQTFYLNPFVFRELGLLTDKDFIINIFMLQELKESITEKDVLKNLSLRFFEAYLGKEYWHGYENKYIGLKSRYGVGNESYLQSEKLLDFLCTKNEFELSLWFDNESASIKGFLDASNYWKFIKRYFVSQQKDIRTVLNKHYVFDEEFLKEAINKNPCAYWYCICVMDNVSYKGIYEKIISSMKLNNIDSELDYIHSYTQNNVTICIGFFEIGLELFRVELQDILLNLTVDLMEVLCFTLIRATNVYYLFGDSDEQNNLRVAIAKGIEKNVEFSNKLNTAIVYYLLTNKNDNLKLLEERFVKVNINHYGTWDRNLEANSYITIILKKENQLYSREYNLGVEIRKILIDNYPSSKTNVLKLIINSVRKYNLIYDNWFSFSNSNLIGEIISTLDFDTNNVKIFLKELLSYDSVISTTTVMYKIFLKNRSLFKSITNIRILNSIYLKTNVQLSYYDDNTDYDYMFATMMSCFDISLSDRFFIKALNNSICRPAFRHEDLISHVLPKCIYVAHQNNWFEKHEIEALILRVYSMLKIMKDTTDSGGRWETIKSVIEICLPESSLLEELYDVKSSNAFHDENADSVINSIIDISINDIQKYYQCEIEDINYSDRNTWKCLISIEKSQDNQLSLLFENMKKNYFPEMDDSNLNPYFYIITALLLDDLETKEKMVDFILEQGGRTGLVNMINAYSLLGEDELARKYIEQLFVLSEALVYPNQEYYLKNQFSHNHTNKIMGLILDSKKNDWMENNEKQEMTLINDPSIKIKWYDIERDHPINEEWATRHPDKNAYKVDYTITYKDAIIEEFSLVYVDGYRALLPFPKIGTKNIPRKKYLLSLLFNEKKNLHDYIRSAGLIVE